jgi:hypothetical protein
MALPLVAPYVRAGQSTVVTIEPTAVDNTPFTLNVSMSRSQMFSDMFQNNNSVSAQKVAIGAKLRDTPVTCQNLSIIFANLVPGSCVLGNGTGGRPVVSGDGGVVNQFV